MTSLEKDYAADLQERNGPGDNDDEKLQVQQFSYPDDAPAVRKAFMLASYEELEQVIRRNAVSSFTVDTLATQLEGSVYDPGDNDLLGWFKGRVRDYKSLKGEMSFREFKAKLCDLLPDSS